MDRLNNNYDSFLDIPNSFTNSIAYADASSPNIALVVQTA